MNVQNLFTIKIFNVISRTRLPLLAILLSLAVHLWALSSISGWNPYVFSLPSNAGELLIADLIHQPTRVKSAPALPKKAVTQIPPEKTKQPEVKQAETEKQSEPAIFGQEPPENHVVDPDTQRPSLVESPEKFAPRPLTAAVKPAKPEPIRNIEQFIKSRREKLSYRISLFGIPVGRSELEAINDMGELKISCRTESSGILSLFYPVATTTQTRMFNGRFIMSTMKQLQGDQVIDTGFTINLGELNVFRADRSNRRYTNNPIPNNEVLDILSALYFLRNRPLIIGETIMMHIFDSNSYSSTPVKVLRREKIILPGLRSVQVLVIKPELTTEVFFRRTGEILIWLTDDEFHVPVRMEAEIALGRITAELVETEAEQ